MALLAAPFEGGGGPSHSVIERIWMSCDAADYLPPEGNKASRVLGGLKALQNGRPASDGFPRLEPDAEKLADVAGALSDELSANRLLADDHVVEAVSRQTPRTKEPETTEDSHSAATREMVARSAVDAKGPIFVVHGHDVALRHEVARVLEKATGRDVIVLHEQANAGQTVLEKFERHAEGAAYAVVLLTGDDVGGEQGEAASPRGRQNVIFELGFFFGKLGRERVAVLIEPGVEQPSDIAGLVYIEIDDPGAWKYSLARELEGVNIGVDRGRIPQ